MWDLNEDLGSPKLKLRHTNFRRSLDAGFGLPGHVIRAGKVVPRVAAGLTKEADLVQLIGTRQMRAQVATREAMWNKSYQTETLPVNSPLA